MSLRQFLSLVLVLNLAFMIAFLPFRYFSINAAAEPIIVDNELKVEVVTEGLESPSNIAFLGPNDILVLEKDTGKVRRIVNEVMLEKPLLDVNVANKKYERGLLGIDIASNNNSRPTHVFLYFTESKTTDDEDNCPLNNYCYPGNEPLGNRLYRYDLDEMNGKLVNPKLLLDLPATPGPAHNGGVVVIGPDDNVYVVVGDILGDLNATSRTAAQNFQNGSYPDGRAGILRVTKDGKTVGDGLLGKDGILNKYYAYGIRNSFGMDFDPVSGNLWDTENGPEYGDEINLVKPGFNSGWISIQGHWKPAKIHNHPLRDFVPGEVILKPDSSVSFVNFSGYGTYSSPKFIWYMPMVPTALKFLNSDNLGEQYENDMFVGDIYGNIYHFDLRKNRTELSLFGPLTDKIANNPEEIQTVKFGEGFGSSLSGITDIEMGPDGCLYVVSYEGTIFRIVKGINAP
ncbi:MAG TPA: PQQ-dependent sugar dehydrogenase [Nitrososphaeraceae archaeon]|nr:PQQ-dependent sugar dehydrogenase [Nitrososphaeraceae archaeon]